MKQITINNTLTDPQHIDHIIFTDDTNVKNAIKRIKMSSDASGGVSLHRVYSILGIANKAPAGSSRHGWLTHQVDMFKVRQKDEKHYIIDTIEPASLLIGGF